MAEKIHRNSLKEGHKLHWYRIKKILGQGGFGITYLAHDFNLDEDVAIKEYLPIELAVRDNDFSVHPVSENHDKNYKWGLTRFIEEARILAKFKHPNIVRVRNVFEYNNTAYMIMEYEQGESLQELLSRQKTLEESEINKYLLPILGGLQLVHKEGFIHRDIKPANIFIREDHSPVLLDFGSARAALGDETKTLTSLVSPGYAPFEQYYSKSDEQGPWTDIYGLAATMYRVITGRTPQDAVDRSKAILNTERDIFVSAEEVGRGKYSERFLKAVDRGLKFKQQERPQTIEEWKGLFEVPSVPPVISVSESVVTQDIIVTEAAEDNFEANDKKSNENWLIGKKTYNSLNEDQVSTSSSKLSAKSNKYQSGIWSTLAILIIGGIFLGLYSEYSIKRNRKHLAEVTKQEEMKKHQEHLIAEREAWLKAKTINTIEGYFEYERNFPDGENRNNSIKARLIKKELLDKSALDSRAWEEAKRRNSINGYKEYMANFARGQFYVAAKHAINDIEKKEQLRLSESKVNEQMTRQAELEVKSKQKTLKEKKRKATQSENRSQTSDEDLVVALEHFNKGDFKSAERLLNSLSEKGNVIAKIMLANTYISGNYGNQGKMLAKQIYIDAEVSIQSAAEKGEAWAEDALGVMYLYGFGVSQSIEDASKWFQRSAEKGFVYAQNNMGKEHFEIDDEKAFKWFHKAAEKGYVPAQYKVGYMYSKGKGTDKNNQKALFWIRKSAEQGLREAETNLGFIYSSGESVSRDYVEALKWYSRAAHKGDAEAQLKLGVMYLEGLGMDKDQLEAYSWIAKSASQGNVSAKKVLEEVF